jgi:TonB family protein
MHFFGRTILLAAVTWVTPLLATPAPAQDFSEMRLREGEAAYRAKRYDAAAASFRLAAFGLLDRPPMLCQALVRLALASDAAGRAADAKWATDRLTEVQRRAPSCGEAELDAATRSDFEARFHRRWPPGAASMAAAAPAAAPPAPASEVVTRESPAVRAPRPASSAASRPAVEAPLSASTDGSGADTAARLKTVVHPIYPRAALQARIGGVVILRVLVSEEGQPIQVEVVQSVRPDLNAAAVAAIKRCVFEPGRANGRPVRSSTTVSVPFQP